MPARKHRPGFNEAAVIELARKDYASTRELWEATLGSETLEHNTSRPERRKVEADKRAYLDAHDGEECEEWLPSNRRRQVRERLVQLVEQFIMVSEADVTREKLPADGNRLRHYRLYSHLMASYYKLWGKIFDNVQSVSALVRLPIKEVHTISPAALRARRYFVEGLDSIALSLMRAEWFVYRCAYCEAVFIRAGSYRRTSPHKFCNGNCRSAFHADRKAEAATDAG